LKYLKMNFSKRHKGDMENKLEGLDSLHLCILSILPNAIQSLLTGGVKMECQICYKQKAIVTIFDESLHQQLEVCNKCKKLIWNEKRIDNEKTAEFIAEINAGIYNLP